MGVGDGEQRSAQQGPRPIVSFGVVPEVEEHLVGDVLDNIGCAQAPSERIDRPAVVSVGPLERFSFGHRIEFHGVLDHDAAVEGDGARQTATAVRQADRLISVNRRRATGLALVRDAYVHLWLTVRGA